MRLHSSVIPISIFVDHGLNVLNLRALDDCISIPTHNLMLPRLSDKDIDRLLQDIKSCLIELLENSFANCEGNSDAVNDQYYEPGFRSTIETHGWKVLAIANMNKLPSNFEGQRLLEGVLDISQDKIVDEEEEGDTKKSTLKVYNSLPLIGRCSLYVQSAPP